MFAVSPIDDCPHVHALNFESFAKKDFSIDAVCEEDRCEATGENWICCFCGSIMCSRYIAGHAAQHAEKNPDHCIAVSFADCSCWCYKCDCYIEDPISLQFIRKVKQVKFGGGSKDSSAAPAAAAAVSEVPAREESVLTALNGATFNIQNASSDESIRLEDCEMCVVDVSTPIRSVRLLRCKKCTIHMDCELGRIEIVGCEQITIRQRVTGVRTCLRVEDTKTAIVETSLNPQYTFFCRCETKNSNLLLKNDVSFGMVVDGPESLTTFDAEKKAFTTTPV